MINIRSCLRKWHNTVIILNYYCIILNYKIILSLFLLPEAQHISGLADLFQMSVKDMTDCYTYLGEYILKYGGLQGIKVQCSSVTCSYCGIRVREYILKYDGLQGLRVQCISVTCSSCGIGLGEYILKYDGLQGFRVQCSSVTCSSCGIG